MVLIYANDRDRDHLTVRTDRRLGERLSRPLGLTRSHGYTAQEGAGGRMFMHRHASRDHPHLPQTARGTSASIWSPTGGILVRITGGALGDVANFRPVLPSHR